MSTTRTLPEATPQQRELIERVAAQIEAEKPDIVRRLQLCEAAQREPGFSGDLRRAIHAGGKPLDSLAAAAQMEVVRLCEFLEGTAELTSDQIRNIANELGLQLVRSIPPATRTAK